VELAETVYALDSTTVDLCLSLFPWAKFRRHKSAVKLHTLLDLRGSIPANVYVTGGQVHDINILDQLLPEAGAFYLLDRGYLDFARLYVFTQACAFFITRPRKDAQFYRRYSRPVERSVGLRCDQTILLTGVRTAKRYPDPLRRIHYFDAEKDLRLIFLTDNFLLPALTITQLYRARWQVELFFLGGRTSGFLFQTESGRPLTQRNVLRDGLAKIRRDMKLEGGKAFHSFRRFRTSHLRKNRVPWEPAKAVAWSRQQRCHRPLCGAVERRR
jgi:Transposase DDE domain